ncbi:MAG: guanylate kinase [Flavobacteriales bacterium]|jgi:guanylate kinase|nr:guanylate kinase [Flavobacteriales bacterium]
MSQGKLIIFSAPSGSGKTTLVHHLLSKPEIKLAFSVSATSRDKRENEEDGIDYHFLSPENFRARIKNGDFLEWEEVYENQFYGTLKSEVDRIHSAGKHVIFDVDVIGGLNIKKQYGDNALAVFVQPPSVKELENRLRGRSSESQESLEKRVGKAKEELTFADEFDVILVNDDLETAKNEAFSLVKRFIQ